MPGRFPPLSSGRLLRAASAAVAGATVGLALSVGEIAGQSFSELPRRAFFGAILAPVPPDAEAGGVLLQSVFPGHSADLAGLEPGDILLTSNGGAVESVEQMLGLLRRHRAGDRLVLDYLRNGERRQLEVVLHEMPRESYPDLDVIYDELTVHGAPRRTILTRPKDTDGPLPTVLLAGGVGCYSVDVPVVEPYGYPELLNELSRRGYVTMRVEKTGIGDSEGPPCAEQDFRYELDGYIEAARAVHRYPFVDGRRVFLLGHSMGGVLAPLIADAVADDALLAGLMVAGTVGTSWFAYEIENRRRQHPLFGTPADEIEERLRTHGRCVGLLTAERRSPAEILAADASCAEPLEFPAHYTYRQQVVDLDMPGNWRRVRVPVLVVYGTSDFLTNAAEHHFIAGIVNRDRPGQATVRILEKMDHGFLTARDYEESLRISRGEAPARLDPRILDEFDTWMSSLTPRT